WFRHSREILCRSHSASQPLLVPNRFQIFTGNHISFTLGVPQNAQHPPASAIVDQLKTVDAALERLSIFGVPRGVSAPHVRHRAIGFAATPDLVLEKTFLVEVGLSKLDVTIGADYH